MGPWRAPALVGAGGEGASVEEGTQSWAERSQRTVSQRLVRRVFQGESVLSCDIPQSRWKDGL